MLRSRLLLGPQGSRGGSSVKDRGWLTWIICSGCCLLAMEDFPILCWYWIKHGDAGGERSGRGAQVTLPAKRPGPAHMANLSLTETLSLYSHFCLLSSQNSLCTCSPLCIWQVYEPAIYSKLFDTTSNTFCTAKLAKADKMKNIHLVAISNDARWGLISQKTAQRWQLRQLGKDWMSSWVEHCQMSQEECDSGEQNPMLP